MLTKWCLATILKLFTLPCCYYRVNRTNNHQPLVNSRSHRMVPHGCHGPVAQGLQPMQDQFVGFKVRKRLVEWVESTPRALREFMVGWTFNHLRWSCSFDWYKVYK